MDKQKAIEAIHNLGGCDATEEWSKGYDAGITAALDAINEMPDNTANKLLFTDKEMTIDEAISHALEVAESCEWQALQCDVTDAYENHVKGENEQCAADHRQLAEWLTELKELKKTQSVLYQLLMSRMLRSSSTDLNSAWMWRVMIMKNRDKILQTCTYDMLVNMANNAGVCPLQAVAGISRETKILRCYKYVHDGCCEKCIQNWLNEEFSTDFSHNCYNSTV